MHCHGQTDRVPLDGTPVILVGNPNVGKSVIFGALTGHYVAVSNYPGTTVEIAQGTLRRNGQSWPVIDTPGIYSLVSLSDDERVTRDILLTHNPATVIQVVDTKNLARGLLIALELAEAGLPFVLDLNMADEAEARGVFVDADQLSEILGVPVISTVATRREGLEALTQRLGLACPASYVLTYDAPIEQAITHVTPHLPQAALEGRSLALMLLTGDDGLLARLVPDETDRAAIRIARQEAETQVGQPLAYAINRQRLKAADAILETVVHRRPARRSLAQAIGRWMAHPVVGWPILLAVLYLVYLAVGVFGAGTLVDLLEINLFEGIINPWVSRAVESLLPIALVREFLVGEYGLITMALTYGLAIVLPIVGTFFFVFSLLEDSGYLPRLAVMLDRGFRLIGLNGKAVLPMILGLGCDTMATMTTRILESRKERLQVTLLLALGVPCSAQLGVILGMVAELGGTATLIWITAVTGTLLAVGYLAAKVIPGQRSDFILELPPIRVPSLSNIVIKTVARVEWYLKEVVPVFVLGTAALFFMNQVGLLSTIERLLSPVIVKWLGLPTQVTGAFLVGFLRRDYGAAGLFALARTGGLSPLQIVVSLVVITLFVPCIANLLVIAKEHGGRTAAAVAAFVFPFALTVGGVLNGVLRALHILAG